MRIAVPVAAYEQGTTGEYVARALRQLGHDAEILGQWQFYDAFRNNEYDLYFCVDSGGPLNLFEMSILQGQWKRLCFWLIDYRRGKTLKNPNDQATAKFINDMGGWVFQAQFEDFTECLRAGWRCSWLPLAADPDVWNNEPPQEKVYDVGFVGNVWDGERMGALADIKSSGLRLCWQGHGAAYMEAGAHLLRSSWVGFNISSFFDSPLAYDVNMRVFETLSCGIPLVTNSTPSLDRIFGAQPFLRTFTRRNQIVPLLKEGVRNREFVDAGQAAREWILSYGTYALRMEQALGTLHDQGML
jgi:hypothetical protein